MAKALKRMMVAEYEQALAGLDGVVVLDPGPMTVEVAQAFRRELREQAGGAQFIMIHNRTARRALENTMYGAETGAGSLDEILKGPTGIVFGGEGPISIAKVLREFRRKFKKLKIKGGVAEGEILGAAEAEGLADLPGAQQLRAMLLSAVIGSARGIASSLQAVYGGVARALQARIDAEGDDEDKEEPGG